MIYVFLADGFEETEAITPIDLLRRAGKEVITVGVTGKTVTSSHNIPMICDIVLDQTSAESLEMIILPGGLMGTNNLYASDKVREIISYCYSSDIFIGAICAAPSILGKMGLLNGRNAVCYPGFEDALAGARVLTVPAVTDGKIITARGAGASLEFSYELIKAIIDEQTAGKIAGQIIWKK